MGRAKELIKEAVFLITPWFRAFPEKLTRPHQVKKFLAPYGTQRFLSAFTSHQHVS
jgi:hypothetical protein